MPGSGPTLCSQGDATGRTPPVNPSTGIRADIQALRGLAVALVVAYHAWPSVLRGGFVGVDVFFVISGFLISGLLLREIEATGRIELRAFYARRLRRLLPAAALVITVTALVFALTHSRFEAQQLVVPALAAVLYLSNLWFAFESVDYLGDPVQASPLLHTWSLAVEEQFYLLWPSLLLLAVWAAARSRGGSSPRTAIAGLVAGVSLLSFAACVGVTRVSPSWAFFGLPTRIWEFGIGAMALLVQPQLAWLGLRWRRALCVAGLACIVASALWLSDRTPFPGWAALWPVAGAFLVIVAGMDGLGWRGRFAAPWRGLGDVSYSLYLWHWPVLIFAAALWPAGSREWSAPAGVGLSLVLAVLTWRHVENPVRHSAWLRRRPGFSLAAALAVVVATLAAVAASPQAARSGGDLAARRKAEFAIRDRPVLYERGCMSWPADAEPPVCEFGDAASPVTVVLLGDSHAAQWFPALAELGRQRRWRIAVFVMPACPVADVEPFDPKLNRPYHECPRWRERVLARLAALRPTLVVAGNASTYAPFVGTGDAPGLQAWRQGMETTLERLTAAAGHVVLMRDTPLPGFHVPRCLARDRSACSYPGQAQPQARAFAIEQTVAAGREGVTLVDLTPEICAGRTCQVEKDGMVMFHDAQHLTATFSRSLSGALWQQLPEATRQALTP